MADKDYLKVLDEVALKNAALARHIPDEAELL